MKKLILMLLLFTAALYGQVHDHILYDYKIVSFQWDPSLPNERVTKHHLYYKESGVAEYVDYVEVLGDKTAGKVLSLKPNTKYTAIVTAINTVDEVDLESGPSNEVEFTTKQFYETPTAPTNLQLNFSIEVNVNSQL